LVQAIADKIHDDEAAEFSKQFTHQEESFATPQFGKK